MAHLTHTKQKLTTNPRGPLCTDYTDGMSISMECLLVLWYKILESYVATLGTGVAFQNCPIQVFKVSVHSMWYRGKKLR